MLNNGNSLVAFNDFSDVPKIPYNIIEVMLKDNSEVVEKFWKVLKYPTPDCLSKPNLTFAEKKELICLGDTIEQDYKVFVKPMVGSSMDDADAQTQIRIYRNSIQPTNRLSAVILFEIDFITNEKTSQVDLDGLKVERTDLMETLFLSFINGRDIKVGSDYFVFNRELSRSCASLLSLSNSKSFYGRSLVLGLVYSKTEVGGDCS